MIGVVIVAHGKLASEYLLAMEHIVGQTLELGSISISPVDILSDKEKEIIEAIEKAEKGSGVIVVTDIHGSTPANLALKASVGKNCVVLFGVNLPMLIKLFQVRNTGSLEEVANLALDAGRKYIHASKP